MDECGIKYIAKSCLYKGKPQTTTCKVVILSTIMTKTGHVVLIGLTGDKIITPLSSDTFRGDLDYHYMGFRDDYMFYSSSVLDSSYKWLVLSEIIYTCNYNGMSICEDLLKFARTNPELFLIQHDNDIVLSPMVWYSSDNDSRINNNGRWTPCYLFHREYIPGDNRVLVHDSDTPDTRTVENGNLIAIQNPHSFHFLSI